jgi:hypothetical protein
MSDQVTGFGSTAFDDRRGRLTRVTFKADSASITWEWSESAWTQVDEMGPATRSDFALVYDSKRGVLLLVGGRFGNSLVGPTVRDTWVRDGKWKAVADMGPSPRVEMASAFDSDRSRVVLFGGFTVQEAAVAPTAGLVSLNDTWEWDGALWRQTQDMGPAPRGDAQMAYDKERKRMVLFGGFQPSKPFGDTWEYFDHS